MSSITLYFVRLTLCYVVEMKKIQNISEKMFKNPYYVYGPQDITVPVKLNFGEFILHRLIKYKDKRCLINAVTHEALTCGQIAQQAMNFAVSLARMGVGKGHTVALCSENRLEFWGAMIGVVCTGAVLTTVNLGYSRDEIKHVLNISKPKFIILSPAAYETHQKTIKSLPYVQKIILFGNKRHDNTLLYNDLAFSIATKDDEATRMKNGNDYHLAKDVDYEEFQVADVEGQRDTLLILYSSGTTGLPKGVMLTHLNALTAISIYTEYEIDILSLTITPWYHTMGFLGTIGPLSVGRVMVFLPKFEVELYLDTIEKYKIIHITVVPPVLVALCKSPIKRDLSSVQITYSGAAPLSSETFDAVRSKFPNVQTVYQGYGMTECTLAITRDPGDPDKSKPGSVGVVLAGTVVKVVDPESRKPLGPNQPGEICVKGVMVMKGYLGKDRREDFDEEGFYKTGDIGYYDDDKYFFIVDRLKELIKYKGYQVPPAEIEAVLLKHEAVKDAAVVGLPDKLAGELPLAFVVLQPGHQITVKELQDFVAERLSNPKHLRGGVRFVKEIPKNPSGKILRRLLKSMIKQTKSKL